MKQKWVKRIARAMIPCFVFFVFTFSFAPKAYAAEANIAVQYGAVGCQVIPNYGVFDMSSIGGAGTTSILNSSVSLGASFSFLDFYLETDENTTFSGPVKLYASYYLANSSSTKPSRGFTDNFWNEDAWSVLYTNDNGQSGAVVGGLDSIEPFTVQDGNCVIPSGVSIEASWSGSEGHPISRLIVKRTDKQEGITGTGDSAFYLQIPSIRIITTAYSAEMEALDNIADAIIGQNDLLLSMKGDIVAILQDIYLMTGDIYEAQNLLNAYVIQMLGYIEHIDSFTIDIYNLLSSQLRLLETAIKNAATSIETAISAQTAAMIAYLESVLNTGNEVPDDTYQQQQDAANILDQMESLEKPNVDTIVPEIGDYTDSGVSGVLSAIFSSNLIVTMMTLSASFAFGAYVLFGKRE